MGAPIIPAEDVCGGASLPEDSLPWVAGVGAGGDEPWKALTAAGALADAALNDPCTTDCT